MFRSLFLKELREQRRNHRLLIVAGALLLAGMISPLLARYTPVILRSVPGIPPELANFVPDPTILDSFVQYIKNVSQFGLIVVLITSMGSIAQEFERGTAAMLFSTPAPRWMVVLSKWLGGLSSIVVGLILATAIFSFYTWVLFGSFSLLSVLALNAFVLGFPQFLPEYGFIRQLTGSYPRNGCSWCIRRACIGINFRQLACLRGLHARRASYLGR